MRLSSVEIPDLRNGYVDVCRFVLRNGRRREARGYVTYDLGFASFRVLDTRKLLPYGVGRELKPAIGYAEATLLCGGIGGPGLLTSISPSFGRFLDGGWLAGSYGPHVRPQMEHVLGSLRQDPDTRQAVVRVHPGAHETAGLRDVPCTMSLGFELDGDELHVYSHMRSNDAFLGLAYDCFQFGQLGWTVANALGVELKTITHSTLSLHVYQRNTAQVESLVARNGSRPAEPTGFGSFQSETYEPLRRRAESVYADRAPFAATSSELLYLKTLRDHDRLVNSANFAS